MNYYNDTIAAISTASGKAAISILRVSGEDAIKIVNRFIDKNLLKCVTNKVIHGKFRIDERVIDDVLCTVFQEPNSYTGENVVEISCHGNPFITNMILEILLTKCRLANPGEFTQRAFLNEKLDLTQAEAVGDLLNAKTRFSHAAAIEQLEGSIYKRIEKILMQLTELRSLVEIEIDFIEQDVPDIDCNKLKHNLKELKKELEKLAFTGEEGTILRDGFKISLVGAPNVGKSSIFNAFLKTERAIVTPIPGTTRDYLEEAVAMSGYLIRLYDTAGIRSTTDSVEKLGIERSYEIIKKSHKIIYITDSEKIDPEWDKLTKLVEPDKVIKVFNKSDLVTDEMIANIRKNGYVICSTQQKHGLNELKDLILKEISVNDIDLQMGMLTNARQIAAVRRAIESIQKAIISLDDELGFEFTAFDLKEASTALEEVIGKVTDDDILHLIFENFCIGK